MLKMVVQEGHSCNKQSYVLWVTYLLPLILIGCGKHNLATRRNSQTVVASICCLLPWSLLAWTVSIQQAEPSMIVHNHGTTGLGEEQERNVLALSLERNKQINSLMSSEVKFLTDNWLPNEGRKGRLFEL
jgi:hypothetical protein